MTNYVLNDQEMAEAGDYKLTTTTSEFDVFGPISADGFVISNAYQTQSISISFSHLYNNNYATYYDGQYSLATTASLSNNDTLILISRPDETLFSAQSVELDVYFVIESLGVSDFSFPVTFTGDTASGKTVTELFQLDLRSDFKRFISTATL